MEKKVALIVIAEQFKKYKNNILLTKFMKSDEFKNSYKRIKLMRETLDTERFYVGCMRIFSEEIFQNLKLQKKCPLEEKDLKEIFSNIDQIYKINERLLNELELEMKKFPNSNFSSIFKKYGPYFKTYSSYINNFDKARECYRINIEKNKPFKEFLSNIYKGKFYYFFINFKKGI
jgi:hypothetical protein